MVVTVRRTALDYTLLSRVLFLTVFFSIGLTGVVLAAVSTEDPLTDIFWTKSFQGSWDVINKFNWAGFLLNGLITVTCLFGLVISVGQKFITFLYFASPTFFTNVYEAKEDMKGSFLGFGAAFKDTFYAKRGQGLDSVISLLYTVMPNVKYYSDYNPANMRGNLSENDNAMSYIMKTGLQTIILIFFFTIGFSGTFARSYGVIVDGMASAADRFTTVNLEAAVTKAFNKGETYQFTLGDSGAADSKFAEKIARNVYSQVLAKLDVTDSSTRVAVGLQVEQWAYRLILNNDNGSHNSSYPRLAELARASAGTKTGMDVTSEDDVKALTYTVVINTSSTPAGGEYTGDSGDLPKKVSSLLSAGSKPADEEQYIHLLVRKEKLHTAEFFVKPKAVTTTP